MPYKLNEGASEDAVVGTSTSGRGLVGESVEKEGVVGVSEKYAGVFGQSRGNRHSGVVGKSEFRGVAGSSTNGVGVAGESTKHLGVYGKSKDGAGVRGDSEKHIGVYGESKDGQGVWGKSLAKGRSGVVGVGESGPGVTGESRADKHSGVVGKSEFRGVTGSSTNGVGVAGESTKHLGVYGKSKDGAGVRGDSEKHIGVYGESKSPNHAGVHGKGTGIAGYFEGDVKVTRSVEVTGDVLLVGGDLAEQFEVVGDTTAQPGSVMVLAGGDTVRVSDSPYDRRVAGVISGAGDLRPGLVLDNHGTAGGREALALSGKVWVLVDADQAPVTVGDLLTTSPTPGHAMLAGDQVQAFGAVIGKALDSLAGGRGLIRALVALQ